MSILIALQCLQATALELPEVLGTHGAAVIDSVKAFLLCMNEHYVAQLVKGPNVHLFNGKL